SVTLDISGLAAKHAFDFSLNRSIAHGFATFYVTYSTIRVFVRFGQAIGVIAWESLDDFPDARKIVNHATSQWPMFIFIVFIPQCLMALSLVGTPWLCKGVAVPERVGGVFQGDPGLSQAFPFHLKWQSFLEAATQDGVADRLQSFVCVRTPLLYLTRPYPNPRRTMSAVLVVGLVQYVQVCGAARFFFFCHPKLWCDFFFCCSYLTCGAISFFVVALPTVVRFLFCCCHPNCGAISLLLLPSQLWCDFFFRCCHLICGGDSFSRAGTLACASSLLRVNHRCRCAANIL
ncbi:unnamed protein product, partial [Ectocarpus sp. 8 AP-2014]